MSFKKLFKNLFLYDKSTIFTQKISLRKTLSGFTSLLLELESNLFAFNYVMQQVTKGLKEADKKRHLLKTKCCNNRSNR